MFPGAAGMALPTCYTYCMKEVSIEYAHIYTNSKIEKEHEISISELASIDVVNKSLVVLVDDYSFPDPTFDYNVFTAWLDQQGYGPNVIMRESQLIPLCDNVLSLMSESDQKNEIIEYVKTKKYPCSLFIAAWYLLRLGKLTHSSFPIEEYAEKLINILPESFQPFEEKGFSIIKETKYKELVSNIENRYILGRSIV